VTSLVVVAFAVTWGALGFGAWFAFQLLRQNGRLLLRVETLEAARPFGDRSLAGSRINLDGLAPGTAAPRFRLPRIDGGDVSLDDYRGRRVVLVFSDPACGPCDRLAPRLEDLSRRTAGVHVVMVSRGTVESNRRKAADYGLTFPIVLQRQWEISRLYAKFATPIAYVIDEQGRIATPVAQGVDPILSLLSSASPVDETAPMRESAVRH
jgi:peroxiredoxin